jgi:hypothetical protein
MPTCQKKTRHLVSVIYAALMPLCCEEYRKSLSPIRVSEKTYFYLPKVREANKTGIENS